MAEDRLSNPTCQPCLKKGRRNTPSKYCSQCNECLCASCVTSHNSFSLLTGHTLRECSGDVAIESLISTPTETCKIHTQQLIEFYCKSHNVIGCSICIVEGHRKYCKPQYIPDFVKSNSSEPNLTSIKSSISETKQKLNVFKTLLQQNREELKREKDESIKKIKKFKKVLLVIIDGLEEAGIHELNQKFDEIDVKVAEEMKYVEDNLNKIEHTESEIEPTQRNLSQKFVAAKLYQQKMNEPGERLAEYLKGPKYSLSFTENVDLRSFLQSRKQLGSVNTHESKESTLRTVVKTVKGKL